MSDIVELPENRLGYEVAINEMKYLIDEQVKSVDLAKSTAQHVLSAASLIVALIGVLPNIVPGSTGKPSGLYWSLIIISAVLYCLLIGLCGYTLGLGRFAGPVLADWNELYKGFVCHTNDLDVLKQQLSCYLNVLKKNRNAVCRKATAANCTVILLPAIVIFLLMTSLVK